MFWTRTGPNWTPGVMPDGENGSLQMTEPFAGLTPTSCIWWLGVTWRRTTLPSPATGVPTTCRERFVHPLLATPLLREAVTSIPVAPAATARITARVIFTNDPRRRAGAAADGIGCGGLCTSSVPKVESRSPTGSEGPAGDTADRGTSASGRVSCGYQLPSDAIHQPGWGGPAAACASGWVSGGYHLPSEATHQPGATGTAFTGFFRSSWV